MSDLISDPWACGPFCWIIDDVDLLPDPIPCRGAQGLWHVGEAMSAALSNATGLGKYRWWQALTVLQPYATAIALGPKRVENRLWRRRILPGGLWLGLHAGKALVCPDNWASDPYGRPRAEVAEEEAEDMLASWRDNAIASRWHISDGPKWAEAPNLADMPRGAMLGAMHIAAIVPYPGAPHA
jgi:hypothetical protein